MARRTQITLEEAQYARLQALSSASGLSMSELVRRALDRTYAARGVEALDATFGMWRDRDDLETLQKRLRPGLGKRLDNDRGRSR
jgi:hypothetical protein